MCPVCIQLSLTKFRGTCKHHLFTVALEIYISENKETARYVNY